MTSTTDICARLLFVSLALALPRQTHAQEKSAAETLFRAGREAMKQEDYDDACAKFAESQRLDPSSGTLLNLAVCEERRGRVATAWARFRELLDTLDPSDPRTRMAREHAAALEGSLPRLRLRFDGDPPAGVFVRLNDAVLSAASQNVPIPVDPGEHRLEIADSAGVIHVEVVKIAMYEQTERVLPWKREELAADARFEHHVGKTPPSLLRSNPGPEGRPETRETPARSSSIFPFVGLAAAGVGVGALGAGTYFGLRAKRLNDDSNSDGRCRGNSCDEIGTSLREQAGTNADVATILFATGAAVGAGGLALFFLTRDHSERHISLGLILRPSPGAGEILVVSRF